MSSARILQAMVGLYIFAFFAYLFGPLVLMSITAFNSSGFPRVSPWDCFTGEWFIKLSQDETLMEGLRNSLLIGLGVVVLSVPIGLAAAIMLTQVHRAIRSIYYTIIVSPILVPGVVLGISTLIFWDRLGTMFDASYKSFFYDGFFLTVIGQSTFISAYCMLVFIARLQRFDTAQEEAALDLGATHAQTFRKILLPFMKPAIFSAAVLAFLASFENYNTTVFTVISESTLTTVLASKVRYGIDPSISALAVIIVALTLIGAIAFEFMKQREMREARAQRMEGVATPAPATRQALAGAFANPAMAMMVLVTIAGLGMAYMLTTYDTQGCKVRVLEEKRLRQQQLVAPTTPETPFKDVFDPQNLLGTTTQGGKPGDEQQKQYQGIFDPQNLQSQSGAEEEDGSKQYQGIFDPGNLKSQAGTGEEEDQSEEAPAKQYQGIFDPNNLRDSGPGTTDE